MRTASDIRRTCVSALLIGLVIFGSGRPAMAQSLSSPSTSCGPATSFKQLFTGAAGDFRRLGSRSSLGLLALGTGAALAAHPADRRASDALAGATELRQAFKGGALLGSAPFELSAAFATYGLGRALGKGCMSSLGADLIQAQFVGQGLAIGLKQATRRTRPSGSGLSFPSGHTTSAFASATVLQQHFGWKVGIPAYAVASYVAVSRVQTKRHYASDVVFGAVLGTVAGRTVTLGRNRFMLSPTAGLDSAGVSFTLLGRK